MSIRHYASFLPNKDSLDELAHAHKRAPALFGSLLRFQLARLVGPTGAFDLAPIEQALDWHAERNKRLVIMPEDKTFNGTNPAPPALRSLCLPNGTGGYTLVRWAPAAQEFIANLILAIGARFKAHPALQGIALQETALGLSAAQLDAHGYSPAGYGETYIAWLKASAAAMPGRPVFWHANFIPRDRAADTIDAVMTAAAPLGTTRLGGPDLWPNDYELVTRVYPKWLAWAKQGVGTFVGVSRPSYAQRNTDGSFMTMGEVLAFGIGAIEPDNVFWVPVLAPPERGANDFYDATPLIQ